MSQSHSATKEATIVTQPVSIPVESPATASVKIRATRTKKPPHPLSIAPAGETKESRKIRLSALREAKLLELGSKRVSKACQYISLIGNLAAYKPTSSDVDAIMSELGSVCASVEGRLRGVKRDGFSFQLRTYK